MLERGRILAGLLAVLLPTVAGAGSFVTFESGQVRPLALSPDGSRLFAVNTPDDRLEVFDIDTQGDLSHAESVPVGLEPVAVAARTDAEVWVVNHLSDSVSIVDVASSPPHVIRTLLVGDEPRDIVFAGPGRNRGFISCAHRGQNDPNDPQLTTGGVGRADVWVFDAGIALEGQSPSIITLFGDTPRALAVSPDAGTVYAAVFHSGNQTTAVSEGVVCSGGASAGPCTVNGVTYPGGLPAPNKSADNVTGPETGLIVKFNAVSGHWEDRLGRNWDNAVRFWLPDDDVFQIDASATPPIAKPSAPHDGQPFAHVGTVLFDMAVNPRSGKVYVTNGDAHNEVRFEGQRPPCGSPSSVVGHLSEARITVLDPGTGSVTPRRLNKHIDYCVVPSPDGTSANSLATPLGMAVTSDGTKLYVAAFGSSDPNTPEARGKVGVFGTAALESDSFVASAASHIVLKGGGASGLVLNAANTRLYVLTRFDNALSVVDTTTSPGSEMQHIPVYNPEPPVVTAGRRFLYDATLTSSNGEAACASCHVFGDFDSLAWDLGNPGDVVKANPNPFRDPPGDGGLNSFHPLKGPMTTQTLRGLANNGPMHWRGDRTGGYVGQPLDETLAFEAFNVAFPGLLGRTGPLTDAQMQAFTEFILEVMLPPNPIRPLDNQLIGDPKAGRDFFNTVTSDIVQTCNGCHQLNAANDSFGTDGRSSFENEPQDFKIPHLRNLYQKVGMFGMPAISFIRTGNNGTPGPFTSQPHQVRGFGFLHDGSIDTLFRFHNATVFTGFASGTTGTTQRRQVEQFMLAFDSDLAPIVGQQVTLDRNNGATVGPRITLLIDRAAAGECDLVVKGNVDDPQHGWEQRGWVRTPAGTFQSDRTGEALPDGDLRALAGTAGQELTYTAVPPGSGTRIGIDRDEDGYPDRTELDLGTDPADPLSFPGSGSSTTTSSTAPISTTTSTTQPASCSFVFVNDPKASVKVNTRNEAGRLSGKIVIDLAAYGEEPVALALSDTDTTIIAAQGVGSLPASGASGRKWLFKSTADGVQKVSLRDLAPRQPGKFKVSTRAKHWFTAAAANQSAENTSLVIEIGDRCFVHAATKKTD